MTMGSLWKYDFPDRSPAGMLHWQVAVQLASEAGLSYEFQQKYNLFYLQNDMVTCMFFEYNINK